MSFWTPQNIQRLTCGHWLHRPDDPHRPLTGVGIDSRTVAADQVFLAIRGERFDGHNFVCSAAEAGAAMAVVSHPPANNCGQLPLLKVEDTERALQDLAGAFRDVLSKGDTKVIAIVGSNGKTTTRNLVHAVLSNRYRGTQSPKSFNNHIGVPLTLLAASPSDNFTVVEIGTNHPGEIESLAGIVRPDAAVLTGVGREHLEFFGSIKAVTREETSVLRFLQPGGLAVVRLSELGDLQLPESVEVVRYGDQLCEGPLDLKPDEMVGNGRSGFWSFRLGSAWFNLSLVGRHNAVNALAAVAIGRQMGIDDMSIDKALRKVEPMPMRMEVQQGKAGILINDAYNANPDSMSAALEVLTSFDPPATTGRRVAILGNMLELGEHGPDAHRSIGDRIKALSDEPGRCIDMVITIGSLARKIAESLACHRSSGRIHKFDRCSDKLPEAVANLLRPSDVVLLKASRGVRLEQLVSAIAKKLKCADPLNESSQTPDCRTVVETHSWAK